MNCYECQTLATPTSTPAVASCNICSIGLCQTHAEAVSQILHHNNGTGLATQPHAARRILCNICATAEHSRG
ncbi:DUF2180 family protein [Streptomyces sp. NPDC050560]|uniref:DUF2180 family protein n=1 Tax=Streptomyces sp. NPDC050560 TaxID=3365630 RepID=UPI0037B38E52